MKTKKLAVRFLAAALICLQIFTCGNRSVFGAHTSVPAETATQTISDEALCPIGVCALAENFSAYVKDLYVGDASIVQFAANTGFDPDQSDSMPRMSAAELRAELTIRFDKTDVTALTLNDIGKIAVVNVKKSLLVRESADADAKVIGKLYQNSGVVIGGISGVQGEWAYILSGKISGWVSSQYLVSGEHMESLYEAMEPKVARTMGNINARKEASLDSDVLAKLEQGAIYPVTEIDGNWVRIQISSNDEGYVYNEYVSVCEGLYVGIPLIDDDVMQEQIDDLEEARVLAAKEAARKKSSSGSSGGSSGSGGSGSSGGSSSSGKSSAKKSSNRSSSSEKGWTYVGRCRVTYYCVECNTPSGSRATASGARATVGRTCAVCRGQIPLGSTVKVTGYGTYVAEDTGVGWNQIDIFVDPEDCDGLHYTDVWYKN